MSDWVLSWLPPGWSAWQVAAVSVAVAVPTAAVSLFVVGHFLARLPADYFVNPAARRPNTRRPFLYALFVFGRNLLGYCLIALGVVLSLPGVPGQGLLTILMGVMLIDFPGKSRLELWLVTRRIVLKGINRLRSRAGRPPLVVERERGERPA